tara:strand:- start:591 stop:1031 length:441 start_codon:yes stop_codon:yes gene_type:complete
MKLIFVTFYFVCFVFSESESINKLESNYEDNQELMSAYYENKKEFILSLKNGEKYRISEVIYIDDSQKNYKVNILNNRLSKSVFYKNNISKVSSYKDYSKSPSIVMDVKLEDILSIESINYDSQIREIRIYSFIILGMYLVFSAFS